MVKVRDVAEHERGEDEVRCAIRERQAALQ